jgi:hypothetical protein
MAPLPPLRGTVRVIFVSGEIDINGGVGESQNPELGETRYSFL